MWTFARGQRDACKVTLKRPWGQGHFSGYGMSIYLPWYGFRPGNQVVIAITTITHHQTQIFSNTGRYSAKRGAFLHSSSICHFSAINIIVRGHYDACLATHWHRTTFCWPVHRKQKKILAVKMIRVNLHSPEDIFTVTLHQSVQRTHILKWIIFSSWTTAQRNVPFQNVIKLTLQDLDWPRHY